MPKIVKKSSSWSINTKKDILTLKCKIKETHHPRSYITGCILENKQATVVTINKRRGGVKSPKHHKCHLRSPLLRSLKSYNADCRETNQSQNWPGHKGLLQPYHKSTTHMQHYISNEKILMSLKKLHVCPNNRVWRISYALMHINMS